MATSTVSPSAIRYGGMWPDGTIKLIDGSGNVLPHGTTFKVTGGHTIIQGPDGTPIQMQSGGGGLHAFDPVTDALGLPGVDPALGYESASANLGLGYQNQDYNTNYAGFQTNPDGSVVRPTDLSTAGRALQDYFTAQDRLNQQYGTQTADLNTNYRNLGENQLQSINASGELGGGALAQALAKRTANQQHDQSALDTAHNYGLADLLTQATRGATDAYTGLQRAVGSNSLYQGTIQAQAGQQAAPGLVGNPNYEVNGNTIYTRLPDGSVKPVKKIKAPTVKTPGRTAFGRPMNYGG